MPEEALPENFHAVRREDLRSQLINLVIENYEQRGAQLRQQAQEQGVDNFNPQGEFERTYLLQFVDRLWMDHIDALDVMRAGIGFRAIGQRDPLVEFKNEAYRMFADLKDAIQHYTVDALLKLLRNDVTITLQRPEPPRKLPQRVQTNAEDIARASGQQSKSEEELRNEIRNTKQTNRNGNQRTNNNPQRNSANQNNGNRQNTNQNNGNRQNTNQNNAPKHSGENQENAFTKVGRNDPCPCGSGKKFKKCHGA